MVYLSFAVYPTADTMSNYISCENSKEKSNIFQHRIHLFLIKIADTLYHISGKKRLTFYRKWHIIRIAKESNYI